MGEPEHEYTLKDVFHQVYPGVTPVWNVRRTVVWHASMVRYCTPSETTLLYALNLWRFYGCWLKPFQPHFMKRYELVDFPPGVKSLLLGKLKSQHLVDLVADYLHVPLCWKSTQHLMDCSLQQWCEVKRNYQIHEDSGDVSLPVHEKKAAQAVIGIWQRAGVSNYLELRTHYLSPVS